MKRESSPYKAARVIHITDDAEFVVEVKESGKIFTLKINANIGLDDEIVIQVRGTSASFVKKIDHRRHRNFIAYYSEDQGKAKLITIDKGRPSEYRLEKGALELSPGDIVLAEAFGGPLNSTHSHHLNRHRLRAKVIRKLGQRNDPDIFSKLAIEDYHILDQFSNEALAYAEKASLNAQNYEDLTHLDFLTIDPEDARDHDDAVYIETKNAGWRLYVAIADVAAYVAPGSILDIEAQERGNSVYFPDRVIPMLPDVLSGNRCSLIDGEKRAVLYVKMEIDQNGKKTDHSFGRGMIVSRASLTYEMAQAIEEEELQTIDPLVKDQIHTLFACYHALHQATKKRGALHLDLPESQVILDENGQVATISQRERLDAHKLIEEAMILANVAAAETLEAKKHSLLYRIHEEPKPEKIDVLRKIAKTIGLKMSKTQNVSLEAINQLLDHASHTKEATNISTMVLRSMRQARYAPRNAGHFGLALKRYAHFTSPIRRYADLILHRSLISALDLGPGGWRYDSGELDQIADHISDTERNAFEAERDVIDRYSALFLSSRLGEEMEGHISGMAKSGLFIKLDATNVDGFAPFRLMSNDHYHYEMLKNIVRGKRSGRVFKIGQAVTAKISFVDPLAAVTELQLLRHDGSKLEAKGKDKARHGSRQKKNRKRK